MKATNKGTCQCCGSVQKLPSGLLSNHGYTVDWGMFNGTCQGAGYLPFEQSTDLIEKFINQAKFQITKLNEEIKKTAELVDPDAVWFERYVPATYSNKKSHYVWEKRGLIFESKVSDTFTRWEWEKLDTDKRDVNRGKRGQGDGNPNVEDAVRFENAKYIKTLETRIKGVAGYVKWQEERIVNWKEEPLISL